MAGNKARKAITAVQVVLAALVLAGAAWLAYKLVGYSQASAVYHEIQTAYASDLAYEEDDAVAGPCPVDFTTLAQDCPDVVGWLQMDDVDVSYPIVQGDDNEHYLHYDSTNAASVDGAIFLDYRNGSLAADKHVLVYGHNMLDESMFGQLDEYTSQDFYEQHAGTFTIYTPQAQLRYKIFSVAVVDPSDPTYQVGFRTTAVFDAFVQQLKANSQYQTGVSASGSDYVVTLSTCSAQDRLVVCAKRISEKPWAA